MTLSQTALAAVGYFDTPGQTEPACKPDICILCDKPIDGEPQLCRSLMVSTKRSYFFCYHTRCKDDERLDEIEGEVVDALFEWDDALTSEGKPS